MNTTLESDFFLSLRVIVGITCLISMFGAFMIILTYIVFKDLRTPARQQLVNLSIADIIVAGSHFVGLVAFKVEDYIYQEEHNGVFNHSKTLCHVQAGFTMCGTIASFLWSLALGLYLLIVIVLRRPDFGRYLIFVYYLICWGVPVVLTLWFALINPTYLGFVQNADVAWCYIRLVPDSQGHLDSHTTIMAELVGYALWFYITAAALVIIYLTLLYYLRCKVSRYRKQARQPPDLKLIFVPLIFLLLRVWSSILNVPAYYYSPPKYPFGTEATYALVFISGIGSSAQGLANAILFCILTKQVRQKLLRSLYTHFCCHSNSYSHLQKPSLQHISSSSTCVTSHEATTQLESGSTRSGIYSHQSGHMLGQAADELQASALLNSRLFVRNYGSTTDS